MLICFVGIDGSGKTLQAEKLAEALSSLGIPCKYTWCRYSPRLLMPMVKLAKRRIRKTSGGSEYGGFTSSKRRMLAKPGIGWLWLRVSLLEYLLQVTLTVRTRLLGGRIVICDRYLYDALADLAINLDRTGKGLLGIARHPLARMFPKPARVYFLHVPPEVAFSRKDDPNVMGEQYLTDRAEIYSYLSDELGFVRIDGTQSIDDIAEAILADALKCVEGENHR